jgi:hypothetical protein
MNMTVFWVVALCSLVNFTAISEVLAASIIELMVEAANTTKHLVGRTEKTVNLSLHAKT